MFPSTNASTGESPVHCTAVDIDDFDLIEVYTLISCIVCFPYSAFEFKERCTGRLVVYLLVRVDRAEHGWDRRYFGENWTLIFGFGRLSCVNSPCRFVGME